MSTGFLIFKSNQFLDYFSNLKIKSKWKGENRSTDHGRSRPTLRRLWPTTVNVGCGSGGLGQLSQSLTRATNTGLAHLAVAKATLAILLGGRRIDAPSAGRSSKLSGKDMRDL